MKRGTQRWSEAQYQEAASKRGRFTTGGSTESRRAPILTGQSEVAGSNAPPVPAIAGVAPGPLTNKYHNTKTNGYASLKEANRAAELRYLEKAGVIRNLSEQVYFLLIPKQDGERACGYTADFAYEEDASRPNDNLQTWRYVVEDTKGVRTTAYIIKRKLMQMVHGIKIRET